MMNYLFFTLGFFLLAFIFMAVGVILSNKSLKGSCGGLASMFGCFLCEKKKSCSRENEKNDDKL